MDVQDKLFELEKKYREVETSNLSLNSKLSELFVLYNLARILNTTLDLNQVLLNIFEVIKNSLPIQYASLYLLDEISDSLELKRNYGSSISDDGNVLFPSNNIIDKVIHDKNEPQLHTVTIGSFDELQTLDNYPVELPIQFVGFPVELNNNEVIGSLNFFRNGDSQFSQTELDFFYRIVKEITNILDKIILFVKTREETHLDHLTGAYNRRYFNEQFPVEFKRAERYKRDLSLLMIDIDNFKSVNDRHGHVKGDELLKNLAQIVNDKLRKSDILVRYGGEEFVVLLPETNMKNAIIVSEKLRKSISKTLSSFSELKGETVTISIGVSNYPLEAQTAEVLLETADRQLYEAKRKGRNRTVYSKKSFE